jgi:hypothetical protein
VAHRIFHDRIKRDETGHGGQHPENAFDAVFNRRAGSHGWANL